MKYVHNVSFSVDGIWDIDNPEDIILGNTSTPVTKMLPVAGKLWCACQNEIMVLSPSSLLVEVIR